MILENQKVTLIFGRDGNRRYYEVKLEANEHCHVGLYHYATTKSRGKPTNAFLLFSCALILFLLAKLLEAPPCVEKVEKGHFVMLCPIYIIPASLTNFFALYVRFQSIQLLMYDFVHTPNNLPLELAHHHDPQVPPPTKFGVVHYRDLRVKDSTCATHIA